MRGEGGVRGATHNSWLTTVVDPNSVPRHCSVLSQVLQCQYPSLPSHLPKKQFFLEIFFIDIQVKIVILQYSTNTVKQNK